MNVIKYILKKVQNISTKEVKGCPFWDNLSPLSPITNCKQSCIAINSVTFLPSFIQLMKAFGQIDLYFFQNIFYHVHKAQIIFFLKNMAYSIYTQLHNVHAYAKFSVCLDPFECDILSLSKKK